MLLAFLLVLSCCRLVGLLNDWLKKKLLPLPGLQALQHGRYTRTGQPVVDRLAAPLVDDHARVFQDRQVSADGRELIANSLDELAHAMFAVGKLLDNPQARRVPERLEERRIRFYRFSVVPFHLVCLVTFSSIAK